MATLLYWVIQADATATPTGAQIVAGQDGTGSAAIAAGSEAYTAAGDYSEAVAVSGLSANTAYEQSWVAYDGSTYSSVVTATITTGLAGTLSTTNSDDTSSASGSPVVTGSLATTNAADTSAASGSPVNVGTLATTNADDTSSVSGSSGSDVSGTVSYTNANDTSAASGTTAVVGTSGTTNADDTAAGAGSPVATGTSGTTNADDTSAASGAAGAVTGTVDATNANDTSSASGPGNPLAVRVGGGSSPRKRRFVHRVGNRLYVTDDEEDAERQAEADDAEEAAQQVIAKAKQGKKPVREITKAVEIPDDGISLQVIRDMAAEREKAHQFDQMVKRAQYDRILALYARIMQEQDDEDVLLMMMV